MSWREEKKWGNDILIKNKIGAGERPQRTCAHMIVHNCL